jgi:small GTP-binding protein
MPPDALPSAKVIFIGDSGVGKTCLMNALLGQDFSQNHVPTTGPEFRTMQAEYRGTAVRLQMWDTAGQEIYRSITRMYFRNSHVVIICYDVTSRHSFANVDDWIKLVSDEVGRVRIIIAATKKDRLEETPDAVTLDELEAKAASSDYACVSTSALHREGLDTLKDLISDAALSALDTSRPIPASGLASRTERKSCC